MIVTCDKCGRSYDDARRWTICPHNSLDVGSETPYCREHDLYNCKFCNAENRPQFGERVKVSYKGREPAEFIIIQVLNEDFYLVVEPMQFDWVKEGMPVAPRIVYLGGKPEPETKTNEQPETEERDWKNVSLEVKSE